MTQKNGLDRGSRKHVLDWTARPEFLNELRTLIQPCAVTFPAGTAYMPKGVGAPKEARIDDFATLWPDRTADWATIHGWWLKHKAGANTPNWDIAVTCELDRRPGLLLVEAKANWPELGRDRKSDPNLTPNSRDNHEHIGAAIQEACAGWRKVNRGVTISRDSHYQFANRLAFVWKLAELGIPVVLLYLGFTGDMGIKDAGEPFADDADWQRAFGAYASGVFPLKLVDRPQILEGTPVWVLSRSLPALEMSASVVRKLPSASGLPPSSGSA